MKNFDEKTCPQCDAMRLKSYGELTDEQKFLVERLPRNTEFTPAERKKHRFCERCWFEEIEPQTKNV